MILSNDEVKVEKPTVIVYFFTFSVTI